MNVRVLPLLLTVLGLTSIGAIAGAATANPDPCEDAGGGNLHITPSSLTLALGHVHAVRAIDNNGAAVSNVAWSVSDAAIAEVVDDDGMFVRVLSAGQTCVMASTATETAHLPVTVLAVSTLPSGTIQWQVQRARSDSSVSVLSAQNDDADDGADAFIIESWFDEQSNRMRLIRSVDADGRELWRHALPEPWMEVAGDAKGGLVAISGSTILRLDGTTGAQSWQYASNGRLRNYTIRQDNQLFIVEATPSTLEPWNSDAADAADLVAFDLATGAVASRTALPLSSLTTTVVRTHMPGLVGPISTPDGTVAMGVEHFSYVETNNGDGTSNYASHDTLALVRIDNTGAWSSQTLGDFDTGGYPAPAYGLIGTFLPSAQGNFLLFWGERHGFTTTVNLALVTSGGFSVVGHDLNDYWAVVDSNDIAYGTTISGSQYVVAAMSMTTGSRLWTAAPLGSYPQIISTRADGGVIVLDDNGQLHRYDSTGIETPIVAPVALPSSALPAGSGLFASEGSSIDSVVLEDDLYGVWQTPGYGNTRGQVASATPQLKASLASVTRGEGVQFQLVGSLNVAGWHFKPTDSQLSDIVRTGANATQVVWPGYLAIGGTAYVKIGTGPNAPELKSRVRVVSRTQGFKAVAVTPVEAPNGTDGFTLLEPPPAPTPGNPTRLGLSLVEAKLTNAHSRHLTDDGPNNGLTYTNDVTDATTYKYIIQPSLEDSNSAFYRAQCGTYIPVVNENGFISGAQLLANDLAHEAGSEGTSHYLYYKSALEQKDKNILVAAEGIVQSDANFSSAFNAKVTQARDALTTFLAANEPCGGAASRDSAHNCAYGGGVNFAPYVSCH